MRKTLKFGVYIIENDQFLENILELEGLINVNGLVASEGIMSANVNFGGFDLILVITRTQ